MTNKYQRLSEDVVQNYLACIIHKSNFPPHNQNIARTQLSKSFKLGFEYFSKKVSADFTHIAIWNIPKILWRGTSITGARLYYSWDNDKLKEELIQYSKINSQITGEISSKLELLANNEDVDAIALANPNSLTFLTSENLKLFLAKKLRCSNSAGIMLARDYVILNYDHKLEFRQGRNPRVRPVFEGNKIELYKKIDEFELGKVSYVSNKK